MENISERLVTLYHGTCSENGQALCKAGWTPRAGMMGGNMGQTRYLYLSTEIEDALWFANQKGCSTVISVEVPINSLRVDPEDGISDTVEEEMNLPHGMPGKLILTKPLGPTSFKIVQE